MAKRKARKSKKAQIAASAGISVRMLNIITKEAANVRRRISRTLARYGDEISSALDPVAYRLENILSRIASGEKVSSIRREINGIGAESIRAEAPAKITTESGYTLTPAENIKLRRAVAQANKNIVEARKKFDVAADIMPQEFTIQDMQQKIVGKEGVERQVELLQLFTPENLVPKAVFETGEAGTQAEFEYYAKTLEQENERRAETARNIKQIAEQANGDEFDETIQGFFRTQAVTDAKPIDIGRIQDMETLKRRASTWDDPARLKRANDYLSRYEQQLDLLEYLLDHNGFMNEHIEKRFDYIRDVISRMYGNEKLITYVARYIPAIDISAISPTGQGESWYGEVPFDEIYNAFTEIEDDFL